MQSKEKKFNIQVVDRNDVPFPFFISLLKYEKPYVVGEMGAEFRILMNVNSAALDITKFYGCKLFLDDKQVNGIKTFCSHGMHSGIKMGNGKYKAFAFHPPSSSQINKDGELVSSFVGKIRIVFFTTRKLSNDGRQRAPHKYTPFIKDTVNTSKKVSSIQIGEGREFDNGHTQRMKQKSRNRDKDKFIYQLNDDEDIDEIELNYIDYYGLMKKGYIKKDCLDHLRYIPYRIKEKDNILVFKSSLRTIIKNHEGVLPIQKLEKLFKQYTDHNINLHLEGYGDLKDFIVKEFTYIIFKEEDQTVILRSKLREKSGNVSSIIEIGNERTRRKAVINTNPSEMDVVEELIDLTSDN